MLHIYFLLYHISPQLYGSHILLSTIIHGSKFLILLPKKPAFNQALTLSPSERPPASPQSSKLRHPRIICLGVEVCYSRSADDSQSWNTHSLKLGMRSTVLRESQWAHGEYVLLLAPTSLDALELLQATLGFWASPDTNRLKSQFLLLLEIKMPHFHSSNLTNSYLVSL